MTDAPISQPPVELTFVQVATSGLPVFDIPAFPGLGIEGVTPDFGRLELRATDLERTNELYNIGLLFRNTAWDEHIQAAPFSYVQGLWELALLGPVADTMRYASTADHRAYALHTAYRQIGEAAVGVTALGSNETTRSPNEILTNLEFWLAEKSKDPKLSRLSEAERSALSTVALLTVEEMQVLTGISRVTLANWRDRGVGPQWLRYANQGSTTRYPFFAVFAWFVESLKGGGGHE